MKRSRGASSGKWSARETAKQLVERLERLWTVLHKDICTEHNIAPSALLSMSAKREPSKRTADITGLRRIIMSLEALSLSNMMEYEANSQEWINICRVLTRSVKSCLPSIPKEGGKQPAEEVEEEEEEEDEDSEKDSLSSSSEDTPDEGKKVNSRRSWIAPHYPPHYLKVL